MFLRVFLFLLFRKEVGLVVGDEIGKGFLLEFLDNGLLRLGKARLGVGHNNGHVCLAKGLLGLFNALRSQFPGVVQTRSVYEDDRAEGKELHALLDGVGGGAGNGGDHRQVLVGQGVQEAGFAGVGPAEEDYMQSVGSRGGVQRHKLNFPWIFLGIY